MANLGGCTGDVLPDVYTVGLITRYEGEDVTAQSFLALTDNLSLEAADLLANRMKQLISSQLPDRFNQALALAEAVNQADPHQRQALLAIIQNQEISERAISRHASDFDIDF